MNIRVIISVITLFCSSVWAWQPQSIEFEGLARVSSASALQSSGLLPAQELDSQSIAQSIRSLYATGLFDDIEALRVEDRLVFRVIERPAIGTIEIEGTRAISKDLLAGALREQGIREGEILDRSKLELIRNELVRQYSAIGLYAAQVSLKLDARPNNRVDLLIEVEEGVSAFIAGVQFTGNQAFDDEQLLQRSLNMRARDQANLWDRFTKRDRFSQQGLNADKQVLEAWYLDRGFLDFELSSTQVSLSPDRQGLYIFFNVSEGLPYQIREQRVQGDTADFQQELEAMLKLQAGDTFSRSEVLATQQAMLNFLTDRGYFFAEVQIAPEVMADDLLLDINYQVQLGPKVYVRQVEFRGNSGTNDETLRREVLQRERSLSRARDIRNSRTRLMRLGFFEEVTVQTPRVAGTTDQIDVVYRVREKQTGNVQGSLGYSDVAGIFASAEITQANVMGTGHSLGAKLQINQTETEASLSYDIPYVTESGIGMGADLFGRRTNFDNLNFINYRTDNLGARVRLGYPTSLNSRLTWQLGFERTFLYTQSPIAEIELFESLVGNEFDNLSLSANWVRSTLNSGFSPTDGNRQQFSLEAGLPLGDLTYYRARYRYDQYWPFFDDYAVRWHSDLAFADAYGDLDVLPFTLNYRAGGPGSVRGFDAGSLGPKNSIGRPFGGNLLTRTGLEFIFPVPFVDNKSPWRTAAFVDLGNVYTTSCHPQAKDDGFCQTGWEFDELRLSAGVDITWSTPIAPLNFVFAVPLNAREDDRTRGFNFSIRSGF